MVEKEAPVSGKIICSVFSLSVFAMNWTILTNIANQWIIHTNALASLGDEASPIAKSFVAEYGGDLFNHASTDCYGTNCVRLLDCFFTTLDATKEVTGF